jgi:hypothetical protein
MLIYYTYKRNDNRVTKRQIVKFYCQQNKQKRYKLIPFLNLQHNAKWQSYISGTFCLYYTANYSESDGQALFYVSGLRTQRTLKILVLVTKVLYEYHNVRISCPSVRV